MVSLQDIILPLTLNLMETHFAPDDQNRMPASIFI